MQLRIATRKSKLALWQAEHVAALLRTAHPTLQVSLLPMSTKGDEILDRSLAAIGGKGLFIKELEVSMQTGQADIAVHSMKDVPAQMPPGFTLGAVLQRADARDAFLSNAVSGFELLARGAKVGTSSLRRECQLRAARPDIRIMPLRGNVDTRIKRLDSGELDAIVLACAGLIRLGWQTRITAALPPNLSLPAVGQGVIGIECRADDAATAALLAPLNHAATRTALDAERAFAERLGGSCQSPIAAHAELKGELLELKGLVGEPDGTQIFRGSIAGAAKQAQVLGSQLAEQLMGNGAAALLARLRS